MITQLYINMRFLTQRISGVQRFAFEICKGLDNLLIDYPEVKVVGFMPNKEVNSQYDGYKFKNIKIHCCGYFSGHLWEQLELSWFARSGKLINLCNTAPLLKFEQYITLHDVIFMTNLDSQKWWFKLWYKIIAKITTRSALKIFTVSKFSKKEIINLLAADADKVIVLGNAASIQAYHYNDEVLNKFKLNSKKYFLLIGSSSVRKNTLLVAKLFATESILQNITLVIAGGNYVNLGSVEEVPASNLIYTGYISDGELRSLYHHAQGLIFPSFYEGFGIPVIEAMSEHCPVIVSDTPIMREVCGDAARYFNPFLSSELKYQVLDLIDNSSKLGILKQNAAQRVLSYQWSNFAKIILDELNLKKENF